MQEEWKTIEEYPNYMVSNFGRIKSNERCVRTAHNGVRKTKERILKTNCDKRGYQYITLYNELGKPICKSVHRLVAKAFILNLNNYPVINHIDCNPSNNNANNLEWCTQSHNIKEAYRLGREKPQLTNLGKFGKNNKKAKKIKQINLDSNEVINYYYGVLEAERETGINFRNIHMCLKGKRKSAGGYKWGYAND